MVEIVKIGDIVRIKNCPAMPEIVGKNAEIVYLQLQEFEKYTVYPVWVKMISDERKGRIYGFQYDDVELLSETVPDKAKREASAPRMEEILWYITNIKDIAEIESLSESLKKAGESGLIKIDGVVEVKRCEVIPEAVNQDAEVVNPQRYVDSYRLYPVWVKILSGARRGKTYGFKYDEIEIVPKTLRAKPADGKVSGINRHAKAKIVEHMEKLLKEDITIEDIAEIERVINEAKGKILLAPALGFWEGKSPCWEMFRCPESVKSECPAFKYRTVPCWQIEGTYCKLLEKGVKGDATDICINCRVYKRWGHGERVKIRLRGKGMDAAVRRR